MSAKKRTERSEPLAQSRISVSSHELLDVLSPVVFLAVLAYTADNKRKGYSAARWLCLREDLKRKWLRHAKHTYEQWRADEIKAAVMRGDLCPSNSD